MFSIVGEIINYLLLVNFHRIFSSANEFSGFSLCLVFPFSFMSLQFPASPFRPKLQISELWFAKTREVIKLMIFCCSRPFLSKMCFWCGVGRGTYISRKRKSVSRQKRAVKWPVERMWRLAKEMALIASFEYKRKWRITNKSCHHDEVDCCRENH